MKKMLIVMLAFTLGACAGNKKPEVAAAQNATTVLAAATALQKGVTAATDAKQLPVPVAQKLTGYLEVVYAQSGKIEPLLRAYHTATSLDAKKLDAAQINDILLSVITNVNAVLKEPIPQNVSASLLRLVGDVLASVATIQQQIAAELAAAK